jgi:rubredoxin
MAEWICSKCGYLYSEDMGDPAHGIPPKTAFEKIPDSWVCPRCGVSKAHFVKKT